MSARSARPRRPQRRGWSRAWPYVSLLAGVASALLMNRSPERAWIVAVAAGASWVTLALFFLVERLAEQASGGRWLEILRLSAKSSTQSFTQLCLAFPLPFYVDAAAPRWGHGIFIALLAIAAFCTAWDPLYQRLVAHRFLGASLQAFAAFVGLNAALPMLGLSNRTSLWLAAAIACVGPAIVSLVSPSEVGEGERPRRGLRGRSRAALRQLLAGALVPLALSLGAAALLPPAPLRWIEGAMGTVLQDRWVADPSDSLQTVPAQLVCATAIRAPRGLTDKLVHAWRHDGFLVDKVAVSLAGGRDAGFRTYSIKHVLGAQPAGRWSCTTETVAGQKLGEVSLTIRAGTAAAP